MGTMDRQDRRNRPIKLLDDGGDCDDFDDHMETRLNWTILNDTFFNDVALKIIPVRHAAVKTLVNLRKVHATMMQFFVLNRNLSSEINVSILKVSSHDTICIIPFICIIMLSPKR